MGKTPHILLGFVLGLLGEFLRFWFSLVFPITVQKEPPATKAKIHKGKEKF